MTPSAFDPYKGVTLAAGFPNIVLIGKMHSGKSTVRKMLTDVLKGYQHVSFAQGVRDVANELFPPEIAEKRSTLVAIGMGMRKIYPDVWAVRGANHADIINATKAVPFVCDDCRFPNEVEAFMEMGNKTIFIHIYAARAVRLDRLKSTGRFESEEQLDGESETALDNYQIPAKLYGIDNSHLNKPELYNKVIDIIDRERSKA